MIMTVVVIMVMMVMAVVVIVTVRVVVIVAAVMVMMAMFMIVVMVIVVAMFMIVIMVEMVMPVSMPGIGRFAAAIFTHLQPQGVSVSIHARLRSGECPPPRTSGTSKPIFCLRTGCRI